MKPSLISIIVLPAFLMANVPFAAAKPPDTIGIVKAGQFTPPPNQHANSAYIALTHQRQETNLCVPTSASIVLQHFGSTTTPREIKTLSRGQKYDANKEFKDFTITFFKDLISGISTLGFTWRQQSFPNTAEGAKSGIAEIKKSIDKGSPVLIDTNLYGGHTFVVSGYDEAANNLFIIDPNISAPGIRVISYKDIEEIWNSQGVGFNGRAGVFTAPKSNTKLPNKP
jgi:uncharacterized protein YvpB